MKISLELLNEQHGEFPYTWLLHVMHNNEDDAPKCCICEKPIKNGESCWFLEAADKFNCKKCLTRSKLDPSCKYPTGIDKFLKRTEEKDMTVYWCRMKIANGAIEKLKSVLPMLFGFIHV